MPVDFSQGTWRKVALSGGLGLSHPRRSLGTLGLASLRDDHRYVLQGDGQVLEQT